MYGLVLVIISASVHFQHERSSGKYDVEMLQCNVISPCNTAV
jgi:hypothetical protein